MYQNDFGTTLFPARSLAIHWTKKRDAKIAFPAYPMKAHQAILLRSMARSLSSFPSRGGRRVRLREDVDDPAAHAVRPAHGEARPYVRREAGEELVLRDDPERPLGRDPR